MSAGTVGAEMPAHVTLDDLAAMAAADENHRYELSPEGVLSITQPADPDHALLVSRFLAWFFINGFGPEQVVVDCGIDVGGGRVPDISVWVQGRPPRRARSSYAGVDGLLLAIEVVSKNSEIADRVVKKVEYAKVGIPHYWIVERDVGTTVHRLTLNLETGEYDGPPGGAQPLAWLLTTVPELS